MWLNKKTYFYLYDACWKVSKFRDMNTEALITYTWKNITK